MPLLNIFPLRYTGTCLIGLCYTHHHAQSTDINPFTGVLKYYKTMDYCSFSRMLIGVVDEGSINGNKEATWTYIRSKGHYYNNIEFDMKINNWKPITAIKLEDPDSTNPKYWTIGYDYYTYKRPSGENNNDTIWRQEMDSIQIPDIRPAIENQIPLDKFSRYKSFSKDGFIRISNIGYTAWVNMSLVVVVLNFNINLYKMDHPDLDIIYYIISNPKSINNTHYTPYDKRSKVC
jgi:hypothetical protein